MIIRGLAAIKEHLENERWTNLENWYRYKYPGVKRKQEHDIDYDEPFDAPDYMGLPYDGYTPRERREYAERRHNAEVERRARAERQHCNPRWGHTYGCDGCCNYGIDYDDSGFATYP